MAVITETFERDPSNTLLPEGVEWGYSIDWPILVVDNFTAAELAEGTPPMCDEAR